MIYLLDIYCGYPIRMSLHFICVICKICEMLKPQTFTDNGGFEYPQPPIIAVCLHCRL